MDQHPLISHHFKMGQTQFRKHGYFTILAGSLYILHSEGEYGHCITPPELHLLSLHCCNTHIWYLFPILIQRSEWIDMSCLKLLRLGVLFFHRDRLWKLHYGSWFISDFLALDFSFENSYLCKNPFLYDYFSLSRISVPVYLKFKAHLMGYCL